MDVVDNLVDPRLKCWNPGAASSRGTASLTIKASRRIYLSRIGVCMCCGTDGSAHRLKDALSGLTVTHIVPNMPQINVLFGTDNHYRDDVRIECESNYLVLCGTQDQNGSCHNEYDNFQMSLYYNKDTDRYEWVMNDGSRELTKVDGSVIIPSVLDPAQVGRKYARLLNWRTIRTLLQPGVAIPIDERAQLMNNLKNWEEDEYEGVE